MERGVCFELRRAAQGHIGSSQQRHGELAVYRVNSGSGERWRLHEFLFVVNFFARHPPPLSLSRERHHKNVAPTAFANNEQQHITLCRFLQEVRHSSTSCGVSSSITTGDVVPLTSVVIAGIRSGPFSEESMTDHQCRSILSSSAERIEATTNELPPCFPPVLLASLASTDWWGAACAHRFDNTPVCIHHGLRSKYNPLVSQMCR